MRVNVDATLRERSVNPTDRGWCLPDGDYLIGSRHLQPEFLAGDAHDTFRCLEPGELNPQAALQGVEFLILLKQRIDCVARLQALDPAPGIEEELTHDEYR